MREGPPQESNEERPKGKKRLAAALIAGVGVVAGAIGYKTLKPDDSDDIAKNETPTEPLSPREVIRKRALSRQSSEQKPEPTADQTEIKKDAQGEFKTAVEAATTVAEKAKLLETALKPLLRKGFGPLEEQEREHIYALIHLAEAGLSNKDELPAMRQEVARIFNDAITLLLAQANTPEAKAALVQSELQWSLNLQFAMEDEHAYTIELIKIARADLPESTIAAIFINPLTPAAMNHDAASFKRLITNLYEISAETDPPQGNNPLILGISNLPADIRQLTEKNLALLLDAKMKREYEAINEWVKNLKSYKDAMSQHPELRGSNAVNQNLSKIVSRLNQELATSRSIISHYAQINGAEAALALRQKITDSVRDVSAQEPRYPAIDWQE